MILIVIVLLLVLLVISNSKYVLDVSKEKAIVIAMIVRADEPSLLSSLSLWLRVSKYFVFVIDNSNNNTIPSSSSIPLSSISSSSIPSYDILQSFIKNNSNIHTIITMKPFTTYDIFREIALNTSINRYPQASHIWLTNSDWLPLLSTININDIDNNDDIYEFIKTNKYDNTTTELAWIVRNKIGLRMKYSFNEIIDPFSIDTNGIITKKVLKWEVHELEKYYR
jgi:hypothetical protein